MFYVSPEGGRYYLGRAFSYGDINYTTAGATADTFTSLGFTEVIPQQRPDDRFYIVSGPDLTGEYSSTPRDLEQLKLRYILEQKNIARQLLSESDWYVLREAEGGAGVPVDFRDYRISVRVAADARCAEVFAAASVEALETLITAPQVLTDDQGSQTPNPDAMTAWPTPLNLQAVVAESYGLAADEGASGGY